MPKLGSVDVNMGAIPAVIDVFDDGLVFIPGSKMAPRAMAFGAIGALVGARAGRRVLAERRQEWGSMNGSSALDARRIDGCKVFAADNIKSISIKKTLLGSGRRLVVEGSSGDRLRIAYNSKKVPTAELESLLRRVADTRVQVDRDA